MKTAIILVMFLFIGAFFIVSNSNLHLKDKDEFAKFYDSYYSWLNQLFSNMKAVTGYVVNFEWLPNNQTSLK